MVTKASYGPGGLVNMLLATRPVVPQRLPDIIAIDAAELHKLASERILVPLGDLIPQVLWDDLFPFALDAVTVDDGKLAIPFQTDILFLAYNSSMVESPPRTWEQLDEIRTGYIFPAARGSDAADSFLLQYYARGGRLARDDKRPHLDSEIVARVLNDYRRAIESGTVSGTVRGFATLDDCWASYLRGDAGLANAGSLQYQRDRHMLQRTRYAQIPTADGEVTTLARSWAWAIVTEDPIRQEVAARYLISALRTEFVSAWTRETFHLPTLRSALV